jgi:hypothetical protein
MRFISSILAMAIRQLLFLKYFKNRIDQLIEFVSAHSLPSSLSSMVILSIASEIWSRIKYGPSVNPQRCTCSLVAHKPH